ncbi:deoxyguanosinetriphosphate triphosphohydrolase [Parafannyhessea umbonata]|uniref:Deoxyguanosinetriphosphate triphosphohydrolase-like protein n=1 Tax=Parafannyhessea umbonata TaxID=604330 RepID=A0A1H9NTL3_9ACTN|nr:deoxyguanosinetriphosphate triphosphohydrolase [Parafannyhessea umbonata]SER39241.1 dGTPase [Parafannyhessea umbonata]
MDALGRVQIEAEEGERLSRFATRSSASLGRERDELPDAYRTCFQRDRDRILHCKSFRRLANKTQVFLAPEGDHYRTRLTHTLEVAQIARDIARPLRLNEDLTEAIALGHDLGHTPFGHAGERALRRAIGSRVGVSEEDGDRFGGLFRHNEQSVRVVRFLEKDGRGLNLTREVLDGIRCHAGTLRASTLEGRVVARADRIAYVNHDIDDAVRAGLLTEDMLPAASRAILGGSSSERIQTMVEDVIAASDGAGDVLMSREKEDALLDLRSFLFENLYNTGDAKQEEPKAEQMLVSLFDYFMDHVDEVPQEYLRACESDVVRVADYVSSMTDRYAIRVYQEVFVPRAWKLGM